MLALIRQFLWSSLLVAMASATVWAQPVVHAPAPEAALDVRWAWALDEAEGLGADDGVWVGYSIRRLMGEHSFVGSFHGRMEGTKRSLFEWIHGVRREGPLATWETIRREARRALDDLEDRPEEKVWKDVALLFRYEAGADTPEVIEVSNLSMPFRLNDRPLLWLGEAPDDQSINLLKIGRAHV